jgi:hypothetical protein
VARRVVRASLLLGLVAAVAALVRRTLSSRHDSALVDSEGITGAA